MCGNARIVVWRSENESRKKTTSFSSYLIVWFVAGLFVIVTIYEFSVELALEIGLVAVVAELELDGV